MTTILMIRHATNDAVGRMICGRAPGFDLNETGRKQAEELAGRLSGIDLDAIYSSPLERALQTAEPLSRCKGIAVQALDAITEIDFGDWTGREIAALESLPEWRSFNQFRSVTRIPNGESISGVQHRVVEEIGRLIEMHRGRRVALISHGDVIKSAICCYAGIPLDLMSRIEIHPASVSVVRFCSGGPTVECTGCTGSLDFSTAP